MLHADPITCDVCKFRPADVRQMQRFEALTPLGEEKLARVRGEVTINSCVACIMKIGDGVQAELGSDRLRALSNQYVVKPGRLS